MTDKEMTRTELVKSRTWTARKGTLFSLASQEELQQVVETLDGDNAEVAQINKEDLILGGLKLVRMFRHSWFKDFTIYFVRFGYRSKDYCLAYDGGTEESRRELDEKLQNCRQVLEA